MSDHNERACTNCGSLLHHEDDCPDKSQPKEVKPCPSSAQSTDGLASEHPVPTALIHPEGSNAAPQGSNPPAGATEVPCPTCHGGGKIRSHPRTYGGGRRCPDCNGSGTIATPPPQPPGGTPEVDIRERSDNDELRPSKVVSASFARTLERQRNEARAAAAQTAAALVELADAHERNRIHGHNMRVTDAEHAIALAELRTRLAATEQRADGAEKERDEARRKATALNGVINQMANAFNAQDADTFWKAESRAAGLVEEWTPELAQATAQRDTAIRERNEARAESDKHWRLREDAMEREKVLGRELAVLRQHFEDAEKEATVAREDAARLEGLFDLLNQESSEGKWRVTLEYDNYQDGALVLNGDGDVLGSYYDMAPHGGDPDAEANAQFRAAIDAALAAKSEGGV